MQLMSNGKVRRTGDESRAILTRWKGSGLSVEEFCKMEDLRFTSLRLWQERLGNQSAETSFMPVVPERPADMRKSFGAPGRTRRFQRVRFPPRQGVGRPAENRLLASWR